MLSNLAQGKHRHLFRLYFPGLIERLVLGDALARVGKASNGNRSLLEILLL